MKDFCKGHSRVRGDDYCGAFRLSKVDFPFARKCQNSTVPRNVGKVTIGYVYIATSWFPGQVGYSKNKLNESMAQAFTNSQPVLSS